MLMECKSVAFMVDGPEAVDSMCCPVTLSSISPSNASHAVSVGFLPGAWPGSVQEAMDGSIDLSSPSALLSIFHVVFVTLDPFS